MKYSHMFHPSSTGAPPEHSGIRIAGALVSLLGLVAIFAAFTATMATVLFFGVLLLLAGAAHLTHIFAERGDDFLWRTLVGALYLLVGGIMVFDPSSGAVGLTLLLAILFLGGGIFRLALGTAAKKMGHPHGWHYMGGGLNLLLGAMILLGWPETSFWVIGLFLGVELLFGGLTLLLGGKEVIA